MRVFYASAVRGWRSFASRKRCASARGCTSTYTAIAGAPEIVRRVGSQCATLPDWGQAHAIFAEGISRRGGCDCPAGPGKARVEDLHALRHGGCERNLHARAGLVLGE